MCIYSLGLRVCHGFVPVNPGVSIGIKSRSNNGIRYHHQHGHNHAHELGHQQHHHHNRHGGGAGDTVVKLHPSLTTDLKPRHPTDATDAANRKAKQTNFQDLKATLLNDALSQSQFDDNIVPDTKKGFYIKNISDSYVCVCCMNTPQN